ncbi:MAG: cyclic nucleotide-binding domain-containing protein [Treponema sp.]|nr:cyclic nucleotide-binding domain-containing protein [Treponema sp.]
MVELIETRAKDPKYCNRKIHVSYILGKTASKFAIRDDGNGFDWKSAAKLSGEDEFHGRGIAMSKELVHSMTYNDKGNEVTFVIANQRNKSNDIPEIIQPFATIEYTNKEIVCREGEMSNDLYFIFSGRFAIYCKGKLTTVLTPNDLFIGEMAFLLNDRRTATVVSVGNSRLIKVPKADFMMLIRKNPHYGIFLSKMLAQRLVRQTKETLEAKKKLEEK